MAIYVRFYQDLVLACNIASVDEGLAIIRSWQALDAESGVSHDYVIA